MTGSTAINSLDLLRRLEPAVRPGASGAGALAAPAPLFESQTFDALLAQAAGGEFASGREMQVAPDIQPPLNDEQMQRLASAADRAEAGGSKRALMMVDGRGLVVDVASRAVVAEMKPNDPSSLLAVDAAMVVGGSDASSSRGSPFAGLNMLTAAATRLRGDAQDSHVTQQLSPGTLGSSR